MVDLIGTEPPTSSLILFLCAQANRGRYTEALVGYEGIVVWVQEPGEVLLRCIQAPPLAVLLDISSCVRCDKATMARVHDMRLDLPVVRTNVRRDGVASAFCVEPCKSEHLRDALEQIMSGDLSWRHPLYRRRRLRVDFQTRAEIYVQDEQVPRRSNTLDISGGGCFLVTYEPLLAGSSIEVSFIDLATPTERCQGRVAWYREWDSGGLIPGVGVGLEAKAVMPIIVQMLALSRSSKWPVRG